MQKEYLNLKDIAKQLFLSKPTVIHLNICSVSVARIITRIVIQKGMNTTNILGMNVKDLSRLKLNEITSTMIHLQLNDIQ